MSASIRNTFTGDVLDGDDLPGMKAAVVEIDAYLDEIYGRYRHLFFTRARLRMRIHELERAPDLVEESRV